MTRNTHQLLDDLKHAIGTRFPKGKRDEASLLRKTLGLMNELHDVAHELGVIGIHRDPIAMHWYLRDAQIRFSPAAQPCTITVVILGAPETCEIALIRDEWRLQLRADDDGTPLDVPLFNEGLEVLLVDALGLPRPTAAGDEASTVTDTPGIDAEGAALRGDQASDAPRNTPGTRVRSLDEDWF